ncbi:MAG: hypothetical protein QOG15_1989 [Solirubrobacteraceae bacterium]|jgi:hypothetical protein|nr:hypothetical protein [Solirubrobacteraceae bacterium]
MSARGFVNRQGKVAATPAPDRSRSAGGNDLRLHEAAFVLAGGAPC